MPRQVSWLTGRHLCLTFPVQGTSGRSRQWLAVHSCGGSFGLALAGVTEFPLSSRSRNRENLDGSIRIFLGLKSMDKADIGQEGGAGVRLGGSCVAAEPQSLEPAQRTQLDGASLQGCGGLKHE
jgi:hypothetical protein